LRNALGLPELVKEKVGAGMVGDRKRYYILGEIFGEWVDEYRTIPKLNAGPLCLVFLTLTASKPTFILSTPF